MNKKIVASLAIIFLVLIIVFAVHFFISKKAPAVQNPTPVAVVDPTANWKIETNTQFGFEFKYPDNFFAVNQEPQILIGDCNTEVFPDSCPNINNIVIQEQVVAGGDINAIKSNLSYPSYWKNPIGEKSTINNVPYCLYQTEGAAMMHEFNSYYYATVVGNQCLVVNLNTSTTNCDAYLPLETGNTEQANNYNNCITTNKNQPDILSQIVSTFKFTNK
jgi:hypothetical protein